MTRHQTGQLAKMFDEKFVHSVFCVVRVKVNVQITVFP